MSGDDQRSWEVDLLSLLQLMKRIFLLKFRSSMQPYFDEENAGKR